MTSILEIAILEKGRTTPKNGFCPEEVVQWIYPEDWEYFLDEVNEAMMHLYREGKIEVTQKGVEIPKGHLPDGSVKIKLVH